MPRFALRRWVGRAALWSYRGLHVVGHVGLNVSLMQVMQRVNQRRASATDVVGSPCRRDDLGASRALAEAAKQAVVAPPPMRRTRKDRRKDRRGDVALDPTPAGVAFVPHPPLRHAGSARKVHMSREQVAARERERGTMVGIGVEQLVYP